MGNNGHRQNARKKQNQERRPPQNSNPFSDPTVSGSPFTQANVQVEQRPSSPQQPPQQPIDITTSRPPSELGLALSGRATPPSNLGPVQSQPTEQTTDQRTQAFFAELERRRQEEKEKEQKAVLEAQKAQKLREEALERQRARELEILRQQDLEIQRQKEIEKQRQIELENLRNEKLEKQRLLEEEKK